jgi:hypothetical protein
VGKGDDSIRRERETPADAESPGKEEKSEASPADPAVSARAAASTGVFNGRRFLADDRAKRSCAVRKKRPLRCVACLVAAIVFPIAVARAGSQEVSPQTRLQSALTDLDAAEPRLDTETRQYLPTFRAVLERVYLDRESATESELQLARALQAFTGSRAVDPGADLELLKSQIAATPGVKTKPEVLASQRKTPGGKRVGVVTLKVGARRKTIAEIAAGAGGYTPYQRAGEVARRLRAVHQKNALWWTQARADVRGNDHVVAAPQAPGGYVITADANYARERGLSRPALASRLLRDIRSTYDALASGGRDLTDLSPEEQKERRRQEAVDLRLDADAAFDRNDRGSAERLYVKARETDPSYVAAYTRLADLYAARKQADRRRAVLRQALARPDLDPADRREIERMLKQ